MRALVVLFAAALVGCDKLPDDRICTTPDPIAPVATGASRLDREGVAASCVHRWSYRLARSTDAASVVADAVMGACWDTIFPLAYATYEDNVSHGAEKPNITVSTRTGREILVGADVYEELHSRAVFHVVQARAGRCRVP